MMCCYLNVQFQGQRVKAVKTKNISAEGGKMVAKRREDSVEKEICIF